MQMYEMCFVWCVCVFYILCAGVVSIDTNQHTNFIHALQIVHATYCNPTLLCVVNEMLTNTTPQHTVTYHFGLQTGNWSTCMLCFLMSLWASRWCLTHQKWWLLLSVRELRNGEICTRGTHCVWCSMRAWFDANRRESTVNQPHTKVHTDWLNW